MRDTKNPEYTGRITDDRDLVVAREKARKLHKQLENFMLTVDTCVEGGHKLEKGYIWRNVDEAQSFVDSMSFVDVDVVEDR